MSSFWKYRIALLVSIIIVVPLGYIVRFSQGLNPEWLHDALGSVAYEIFWILLFAFILPKVSPLRIAIAVCIATCAIEFLQLWKPPFLQAARSTLPGRLILGNTFVWADFPVYFVGSFIGWLWVRFLTSSPPKFVEGGDSKNHFLDFLFPRVDLLGGVSPPKY